MGLEFKTDVDGKSALIEVKGFETITEDVTLDYEDSGRIIGVGTNGIVASLPETKKGIVYTFVNSGADGNNDITLSPDADDAIIGTIANSAADSVASGVDGKDFVNTQDTANRGDRITVVGDGVDGWYIVNGVGIWASEA